VTASLIVSIVALILFVGFGVAVAVIISHALRDAFLTLDRAQQRHTKQQDKLLDRLMTIKWEDYVATRSVDEADEGGFIAPGEDEDGGETEIIPPAPRWGSLSALRERMVTTPDEQALLDEDFPEVPSANR
jgi:hypothetical protein